MELADLARVNSWRRESPVEYVLWNGGMHVEPERRRDLVDEELVERSVHGVHSAHELVEHEAVGDRVVEARRGVLVHELAVRRLPALHHLRDPRRVAGDLLERQRRAAAQTR